MFELFPSRTVAVEIFGFDVYWYGVLYLVSFILAAILLPRLQHLRRLSLTQKEWGDILTLSIIGVLLGGRIGYVLLYRFSDFLSSPWVLFDIRSGGMASHGGFIGVALALLWVLRKRSWEEKLAIVDVAVIPVAIGLALGRLGNFINQELYGTVTSLPWGMNFPGAEGLRHPTQLYAIDKNLFIAAVCFLYLYRTRANFVPGRATALFLMLYGVLRFIVEFFRDQQSWVMELGGITISPGHLYTLPLLLFGAFLWWKAPQWKESR